MPRIPEAAAPRRIAVPSDRVGRQLQQGFEQIGEQVQRAAVEYQKQSQSNEFVKLSGEMEAGLLELQLQIERDPEMNTVGAASAAYAERSREIIKGTLGRSKWKLVSTALEARGKQSADRGGFTVNRRAYRREVDAAVADLDANRAQQITEYAMQETVEGRVEIITNYKVDVNLSPYLSDTEKQTRIESFLDAASLERAAVLLDQNPALLATIAEDEDEFPGLLESQRIKIREAAEAEVDSRGAKERARRVSDLDLRISRSAQGGEDFDALEHEVRQAFDNEWISGPGRTQRIQTIDRMRKAQQDVADGRAFMDAVMGGTVFLDPKDKTHKQWLDTYYQENVAPAVTVMNPDEAVSATASFSLRAGAVPGVLKSNLRAALRGGDVPARSAASRFVAMIGEVNPLLLDDFENEDIAFAQMVSSYVIAGIPEAQAVERTNTALRAPEAEKEARRQRYVQEQIGLDNRGWLEKHIGEVDTGLVSDLGAMGKFFGAINFWDPDVEIPDRMAGEFDFLTEQGFQKTGDSDVSRTGSLAALKRTWGVTSIGGRRWQKYAPEVVYANGAGIDWIHEQAREDLESLGVIPRITEEENVRLEPDLISAREGLPAYIAMMLNENGEWASIPAPPWRPDYEASSAKKRADEETRAVVDAAIRKRKALIAKQRDLLAGAVPPEVFE